MGKRAHGSSVPGVNSADNNMVDHVTVAPGAFLAMLAWRDTNKAVGLLALACEVEAKRTAVGGAEDVAVARTGGRRHVDVVYHGPRKTVSESKCSPRCSRPALALSAL